MLAGPTATRQFDSVATMRLFQNMSGLFFEASVPLNGLVSGWLLAMRQGALGASIEFRFDTLAGQWSAELDDRDRPHIRHTDCQIRHVALCLAPAYKTTACWLADWEGEGAHKLPIHVRSAMEVERRIDP